MKPKAIKTTARLNTGQTITYNTAWRVKQAIAQDLDGDDKEQFQLIGPMLKFLQQHGDLLKDGISDEVHEIVTNDGSGYDGAFIRMKIANNVFQAAAILPTAMKIAWHHNRNLMVFDGAYCSSIYGGILLIATSIDANENTLVLAWAIVPTESAEWWSWFFELAQIHLVGPYISAVDEDNPEEEDEADDLRLTIITDRGKGLDPAIKKYFPEPIAFHYFCTQHLAENVRTYHGLEVEVLFRMACQAPTKAAHHALIEKIRTVSTAAVTYIDEIGDKARYVFSLGYH